MPGCVEGITSKVYELVVVESIQGSRVPDVSNKRGRDPANTLGQVACPDTGATYISDLAEEGDEAASLVLLRWGVSQLQTQIFLYSL